MHYCKHKNWTVKSISSLQCIAWEQQPYRTQSNSLNTTTRSKTEVWAGCHTHAEPLLPHLHLASYEHANKINFAPAYVTCLRLLAKYVGLSFLFLFFPILAYWSNPCMEFYAHGPNTRCHAMKCLFGVQTMVDNIFGFKFPPKTVKSGIV